MVEIQFLLQNKAEKTKQSTCFMASLYRKMMSLIEGLAPFQGNPRQVGIITIIESISVKKSYLHGAGEFASTGRVSRLPKLLSLRSKGALYAGTQRKQKVWLLWMTLQMITHPLWTKNAYMHMRNNRRDCHWKAYDLRVRLTVLNIIKISLVKEKRVTFSSLKFFMENVLFHWVTKPQGRAVKQEEPKNLSKVFRSLENEFT